MPRPLLLALLALAAAATVAFLLVGTGGGSDLGEDLAREGEPGYVPPELRGRGGRARPEGQGPRTNDAGRETGARPMEGAGPEALVLDGHVLAEESGEPLAGARVQLVLHRTPCPRIEDLPDDPFSTVATDDAGAFAFRLPPPVAASPLDVVVLAPGHVARMVCAPELPSTLEIRLKKGLVLEGRVVDPRGRPVGEATVRARPAPETPAVPGHGSLVPVLTDAEQGHFALDGFLPGDVLVTVDHPAFMPWEGGPFDPAHAQPIRIVLAPALRATFRIRTDDGRRPQNATLIWTEGGAPEKPHVLLLPCPQPVDAPEGARADLEEPLPCGPVRLPARAKALVLEVKADGYAAWRSESFRPPPEGGVRTFDVTLAGDLGTGSIRASLEDEEGTKVRFDAADVKIAIARLDPGPGTQVYVVKRGEDLLVTSLPAGSYRLMLTSARFAPVQTDVGVTAGQEAPVVIPVGPPAKLRVSFLAPREVLVRFRLLRDGKVVRGVPEGAVSRGTDPETGEPILAAGSEGLLLSGLASGTYTIEVTSEEVGAPPTIVHLVQGDTVETRITVR